MNSFAILVCAVLALACLSGGWMFAAEQHATAYQRTKGVVLLLLGAGSIWIGVDRYMDHGNGGDYHAPLTERISERLGPYLAGADVAEMRLCEQSGFGFQTHQATCVTFEDGLTVDVLPAIATESGELRLIERTILLAMQDAKGKSMATYRVYVDVSDTPAQFEEGANEFGRVVAQALEAAKAEYAKRAAAEQAKATWGN